MMMMMMVKKYNTSRTDANCPSTDIHS